MLKTFGVRVVVVSGGQLDLIVSSSPIWTLFGVCDWD